MGNSFTAQLRNAGFGWATAINPSQPILSCWDDNNNTQAVDVHRYDTNFPGWASDIFSNPGKGGVITEGGTRWFEGTSGDAGSVKTVMAFLQGVRQDYLAGKRPFQPGAIISWEVNVGNSNTRWHWGTPDHTKEPTIPWDAHIHVDQTPISFTEAALIKNYTSNGNKNPFLFSEIFNPMSATTTADYYGIVNSTAAFAPKNNLSTAIYEMSWWPQSKSTVVDMWLKAVIASNGSVSSGYRLRLDQSAQLLTLSRFMDSMVVDLGTFDFTTIECGVISNGWNIIRAHHYEDRRIDVYINPMHSDAITTGIKPRLSVNDTVTLPGGEIRVVIPNNRESTWIDYIAAIDETILFQQ